MTREQMVLALQQEYARRREDNLRVYEEKKQAACERCPGLRALLDARHAAVLNGVRTSLLSEKKNPGANAGLPGIMAQMNRKIAAALEAGGLPADALKPVYTCPICRDEGYVYEPSRRMCDCMAREMNRRMLDELGMGETNQTFERFDASLFSDEPEPNGTNQRKSVTLARNVCEAYADAYPDTETRNLLLMGKSGLGKTYLLNAIAHRVVDRGLSPRCTTAYHLLETARKAYMENNSEHMAGLINAPLLLIDDLGTEPLMQNITVTQLFNLLNERQRGGRHTVISTNLSLSELKERYTERIASRLMDGTSWRRLTLIGDDVRKKLKRS